MRDVDIDPPLANVRDRTSGERALCAGGCCNVASDESERIFVRSASRVPYRASRSSNLREYISQNREPGVSIPKAKYIRLKD